VLYSPALTDFSEVLAELETNVGLELQHHNPNEVAVYMVSGAEGVRLLAPAKQYPNLNNIYWYGTSGFCGNREVLNDTVAALFTYTHGLPCPIPSPDDDAGALWQPVHDRLVAITGHEPGFTSFVLYDAVGLAAQVSLTAGNTRLETLQALIPAIASGYFGTTGNLRLDANGDRAAGYYDFLAVKSDSTGYCWKKVARYCSRNGTLARIPGR
ncbi:MAG TPA: hypothetical protein PKG48_03525, partial [Bacteroidales bacterium]|nr:hypothetical protein [Bacteroidales bacterium]